MPYCAIDFGKTEYPFDVSPVCNRTSAKIMGCVNYLARKFPNLVLDRFGILDKNCAAIRLPVLTNWSLIDFSLVYTKNFAFRDLDSCPVLCWSGGIDSTFIAACFLHEGINFRVAYNEQSLADSWSEEILKKLESNNIYCCKMYRLEEYAELDNCVTGDGADILFSPSVDDLVVNSPRNQFGQHMGISDALSYVYPNEGKLLYNKLLNYGKKLRRNISGDRDLSRLINWGTFYYFKRDYFRAVTGAKKENMIPFFDDSAFMDISYTSYWNSTYEDGCKEDRRKFIASVFGKSVFKKIRRNPSPYYRPSNLDELYL